MILNSLLITGYLFLFTACNAPSDPDLSAEKEAMKQADIAFSKLSEEKGMKTAFLQYLDSGGILLRPNLYPVVGSDAFQFLQNINDSAFTLTWAPQAAEMARSGDLGFTYGLYTFKSRDTSFQGTYVSIWKKQKDGSWKYILDSGNTGVGAK